MEEALRLESMRSQARLSDFTFTFLSNDLKVHLLCHKCHGFLLCTAICHHCVCMCVYTQFTFKQCGSWEADTTTAPPAFKILHRPVNSNLRICSSAPADSAKLRSLHHWSMRLPKRAMCKWTHIVGTGVLQGPAMYAWVNVWPCILFH